MREEAAFGTWNHQCGMAELRRLTPHDTLVRFPVQVATYMFINLLLTFVALSCLIIILVGSSNTSSIWHITCVSFGFSTSYLTHHPLQSTSIFIDFLLICLPVIERGVFKYLNTVMDWSIEKFILNTGEKIGSHDCVLSGVTINIINYFLNVL